MQSQLQSYPGISEVHGLPMSNVQHLDEHGNIMKREEPSVTWIAFPKDPADKEQTDKTTAWLEGKVTDERKYIHTHRNRKGHVTMWSSLTLDEAGLDEAKNHDGILAVEKNLHSEGTRAIDYTHSIKRNGITKREDLQWETQLGAPVDLAVDSQYK
jgi:hypothetical protein